MIFRDAKYALYAIEVSYTYLNMRLLKEPRARINSVALQKKATNCIKRRKACRHSYLM